MKQQITREEVEGKTITAIKTYDRDMVIMFADGTFLHCSIDTGYDHGDEEFTFPPIGEMDIDTQHYFELISTAQYQELQAQKQREWEAKRERQRRREYEQLKAMFEAPSGNPARVVSASETTNGDGEAS